MTWTKELDEAAEMATRRGHWHTLLFYLLCGLAAIPTSFLVFSQVFTNATPEHWCSPEPELKHFGLSIEELRKLTVPETNGVYETCKSYSIDIDELRSMLNQTMARTHISRESSTNNTSHLRTVDEDEKMQRIRIADAIVAVRQESSNCSNGWKFSEEHYKRTLVTQFLLVCDKDWLPRTSNTLFWVGSIFGNLFFGAISDRYGRRPTILLMILIEVPLTIAASFSSNYWMYIVLRVLGGLFFPALYQLPFILALELMPPAKRTYTGIVVGMLFASGMCLLALLAFFLRDWYHLSLATSIPFVVLFGYYWLIPESPRWLVGRGRVADAEKVYINLAKRNGITLPRGFLIELHNFFRDEEVDVDLGANKNGCLQKLQPTTEEITDRRIYNMITFQSQIKKEIDIKEQVNLDKGPEEEDKIDVCTGNPETENNEDIKLNTEEKHLNYDSLRTIDTEQLSPVIDLRKKSIQVVNRILLKDSFEDVEEKKKIDDQNSEGDCRASPIDLFRYPNLRKKFLILTFNWVALGVVYNSLSYNTPNLGVDDYIAFFIGGAVELPSYFIAWFSMEKYGRRWVLSTFLLFGGLSCLSCVLVPETWPWVTVSLAMLGRLCAAASFAVFYVQIGELLPTVVRAQAMGASSFIAGVGLLTCPYIVHLAVYSRSLPLIIMGVLSLVAAITSLFLPETLNQPLPQTLGDGEMFGRNFKIFSFVEKG